MSKNALLVILCAMFWEVAMCASPPQEGQEAIASSRFPRLTDDITHGPRGFEAARKGGRSLSRVIVWALAIVSAKWTLRVPGALCF